MKKYIAYVLVALVMCCTLCGCGRNRGEDMSIIESPIIDVETDMNDGMVEDKDGIIEDKDTGSSSTDKGKDVITGSNSSGIDNGATTVSPSPEVSAKP